MRLVADPARGLLDRRGKGKQKRSRSGVQIAKRMRTKTIPPEAKSEIPNPVEKDKAQQKQKTEKASETIIDTTDRER